MTFNSKLSHLNMEENDCPFELITLDETSNGLEPLVQRSVFYRTGNFHTHETMDVQYTVELRAQWLGMMRYKSFVLQGFRFNCGGFVYIANDATINISNVSASSNNDEADFLRVEDGYVAYIAEIRAADADHVYARVIWMYSPDELPKGTLDGKKRVEGRQPYHGKNELVASNHMDIVNIHTVVKSAVVEQWIETKEVELEALYWRQAIDYRTSELSTVGTVCKCETPENPDKMLICCTNPDCGVWLHEECLQIDVLTQTFRRLGQDEPHLEEGKGLKREKGEESTTSLSKRIRYGKENTSLTIDVCESEASFRSKPEVKSWNEASRKKKMSRVFYESLFEVALQKVNGSLSWDIEDLRPGISGGESTWKENVECICCGIMIT